MIRLWLARGTTIPMREQLSAQLILGILSRRLAPGERLPSVRELGRRLKLHPNTISATYQDLEKRGWVSRRRGSGVFVRDVQVPEQTRSIEGFVSACIEEGLARGFSLEALQSAFGSIVQESRTPEFLVVDPDPDLARILAAEIGEAIGSTLPFSGLDDASPRLTPDTCVLANEAHVLRISKFLGSENSRAIHLKSMQDMLVGKQRPTSAVLIAVVSHSESILHWASTLLSSLGFPADCVLQRNPRRAHWQDGLQTCEIVAADVVAAAEISKRFRPSIFRIVSDEFLADMRQLVTAQKLSQRSAP
jgi:DNA-binding transcriptional regulator YhcF (GntR family)